MKVLFSYGKAIDAGEARLHAFETVARKYGIELENVPYEHDCPADDRAAILLDVVKRQSDPSSLILVGSSMGCYGSVLASMQVPVLGMFLISPALFMYKVNDYSLTGSKYTAFVLGGDDPVIPVDKVLDYVRSEKAEVHVLPEDHHMVSSVDYLAGLFDTFLSRIVAGQRR